MKPVFQIGSWVISSYFLVLSLVFSLMLFFLKWRAHRLGFPVRRALDVAFISASFGFLGARLFHIFYEAPGFYRSDPWAALYFWAGGYVILPGLLTGLGVGLYLVRRENPSRGSWLDLFAPVLALGYSLGRWACFLQGCCYGRVTQSFWGVSFHPAHDSGFGHEGDWPLRIPTQLVTSLGELLIFMGLIFIEAKGLFRLRPGALFFCWMVGHGLNRVVMELLRDDPRGPLVFGQGISLWISLSFVFFGGALLFKSVKSPYFWSRG